MFGHVSQLPNAVGSKSKRPSLQLVQLRAEFGWENFLCPRTALSRSSQSPEYWVRFQWEPDPAGFTLLFATQQQGYCSSIMSLFCRFLTLLFLLESLLVHPTTAALVNRTIDDQYGDSMTKVMPIYSSSSWSQGNDGSDTALKIDPCKRHYGSFCHRRKASNFFPSLSASKKPHVALHLSPSLRVQRNYPIDHS
jgi:hypothetical protein